MVWTDRHDMVYGMVWQARRSVGTTWYMVWFDRHDMVYGLD